MALIIPKMFIADDISFFIVRLQKVSLRIRINANLKRFNHSSL